MYPFLPFAVCSVSLTFGVIAMTAGIIGVPLGTAIGEGMIKRFPFIHPVICGVGMFLSAGFFLLALFLMETQTVAPLVLMFLGQLALNLNWAIVCDMLLVRIIHRYYFIFYLPLFSCFSFALLFLLSFYYIHICLQH